MRRPQFVFFRGSTPTLELELPLTLAEGDAVYATFAQGGETVLEYAWGGTAQIAPEGSLTRSGTEDRVLLLQMTQADTLRFRSGECELQLRIRTAAGADSFPPCLGLVGGIRKEGEI